VSPQCTIRTKAVKLCQNNCIVVSDAEYVSELTTIYFFGSTCGYSTFSVRSPRLRAWARRVVSMLDVCSYFVLHLQALTRTGLTTREPFSRFSISLLKLALPPNFRFGVTCATRSKLTLSKQRNCTVGCVQDRERGMYW
jgi:hypothetical protein